MLVEILLPAAREHLATVGDDASVIQAAKLLGGAHINLVVVCNSEGVMIGVLSRRDVARQVSHCQGSGCTTAVSSVMTREIVACSPRDRLRDVWSIMKNRGLRHIPIVDKGSKPLGIIYARDALQTLLTEVQDEQELLRDYVTCAGYH
jgi:CBS domain-containing protein